MNPQLMARGRLLEPDKFVDETYVKVAGRWIYLYRAIDQYGQVIDVLMSQKRDLAAARRFSSARVRAKPPPRPLRTRP